eukprot:1482929-Rhodomonas_salina.1
MDSEFRAGSSRDRILALQQICNGSFSGKHHTNVQQKGKEVTSLPGMAAASSDAAWNKDEVPVGDTSVVCFQYKLEGDLCKVIAQQRSWRADRCAELVKRVPAFVYCLVADENVFALFGEKFVEKFNETGKTLHVKIVSSGETTKDRKVKEEIEDFMLS